MKDKQTKKEKERVELAKNTVENGISFVICSPVVRWNKQKQEATSSIPRFIKKNLGTI